MGLIDEFRNTLPDEDAKTWHERFEEQRHLRLKASDDCYNTLAPAPAAAPRNVETATKRLENITALVEALTLAEHIDRLLGVAPNLANSLPEGALGNAPISEQFKPVSGQVELLHKQIDVLDRRLEALHALVQRLDAV